MSTLHVLKSHSGGLRNHNKEKKKDLRNKAGIHGAHLFCSVLFLRTAINNWADSLFFGQIDSKPKTLCIFWGNSKGSEQRFKHKAGHWSEIYLGISCELYLALRILYEFPEAPSSKWWPSGGWWKQMENLCLSSLNPSTPSWHSCFWEGGSDHRQLKFYSWKSVLKKPAASLLKERCLM